MSIDLLGEIIAAGIKAYGEGSDRSVQSAEGRIGPSDLGFCRQKAALMIRGIPQSDSDNYIFAAGIGTAIHEYYSKALRDFFPEWTLDSKRITATFPSGYEVSGTPDIIATDYNAIVDIKSVDGYEKVSKYGPSMTHRYQRHTYALAAIQEGLLDPTKPVWVANYYVDRSAREGGPYFSFEEFDPTLTDEIDEWIGDVVYAVKTGEDASRDVVSVICSRICSHFTACRGGLEVHEGNELITDEDRLHAVEMVVESKVLKKKAEKMYDEARVTLIGTNGVTDTHQVRWVSVGAKGTMRLDVDEIPARQQDTSA